MILITYIGTYTEDATGKEHPVRLTWMADQTVHLRDGRNITARYLGDEHPIAKCCTAHEGRDLVPVHQRGRK